MEDKKKNEGINDKELEQVAGGFIPGKDWYQDEQGNWVVDRYGIEVVHNGDPEDRFKNGDYMLLP
jgi:hypothetical protein